MLMQQQPQQDQQQTPSNEELCNLLVQSLIAKDEKLLYKVLEHNDEAVIKDIINRVPVIHVRKLIIELTNTLSTNITTNHLQWLQHLLALKFSVVSSMADGRSILLPLISLLEDRSSPAYYNKMQTLKGKLILLKQLKDSRKDENTRAETVVKVPVESDQPAQVEIESETDTESEEDFAEDIEAEDEEDALDREDNENNDDDEDVLDDVLEDVL